MTRAPRVVLVNPRITSRGRARFPLSLLNIAAAMQGRHDTEIVDGNVEPDGVAATLAAVERGCEALGVTVMGGPQVRTAIDISRAVRARHPSLPIVWGGYFPSLYPDVALNCDYVDYVVRGQGEQAMADLVDTLAGTSRAPAHDIAGLSYRHDGVNHHHPEHRAAARQLDMTLPYEKLGDPRRYLVKTFMGQRTAAYQAQIGCRFRCTFCGVAAVFRGATTLPAAQRLELDLRYLRERIGADSIQFYDHNFFDREADMVPLLEIMARERLPWWCYARADALVNLSPESWKLVRRSGLRMAYIGAETPNDRLLKSIRKGTHSDQTLEVVETCRRNGVVPELSFMVAPPGDPEGETERTFSFIRRVKKANPDSEIIIYIYTPLPPSTVPNAAKLRLAPLLDRDGTPIQFPRTPEEWTEPRWVDYACHADAPWLTDRLRRRIRDFGTVLRCRFPTVQDTRAPAWTKRAVRGLAAWRYRFARYDRPWELYASQRLVRLLDPRITSI